MKFWMVLGAGTPVKRHPSKLEASTEAERLARLHPGQVFTVLGSLGEVVKSDMKWESHDMPGCCEGGDRCGIPF